MLAPAIEPSPATAEAPVPQKPPEIEPLERDDE
jgi:hypothetical protein